MDLSVARAGKTSVITVNGEIDANTGYPVYLAALKEAENGAPDVVLDLAGVTFIDSVGLGMLIRSRDDLADRYKSTLILREPSPRVSSLLKMTALTGQFTITT